MLRQPKTTKFKKYHKGKVFLGRLNTTSIQVLKLGTYGLEALEAGRMTARHAETIRKIIRKVIKRSGKMWIHFFPHTPVSAKPNENRMGKGKGKLDYYTGLVQQGEIIVEISGINKRSADKLLSVVSKKLPVTSRLVSL